MELFSPSIRDKAKALETILAPNKTNP